MRCKLEDLARFTAGQPQNRLQCSIPGYPATPSYKMSTSSCIVSIDSGAHRSRVLARRDKRVNDNLDLVPPIAERIHKTLPPSFELQDLVQTGRIGLLNAAIKYSPAKNNGTPFPAYASRMIRFSILDSIKDRNYTESTWEPLYAATEPRSDSGIDICIDKQRRIQSISRERKKLSELQAAVIDAYFSPSEPTFREIAEYLGIADWRVQKARTEAIAILQKALKAA